MRTTPFAEFLILPTGPTVTSPLLLVLRVIFVTDLLLFCVLGLSRVFPWGWPWGTTSSRAACKTACLLLVAC